MSDPSHNITHSNFYVAHSIAYIYIECERDNGENRILDSHAQCNMSHVHTYVVSKYATPPLTNLAKELKIRNYTCSTLVPRTHESWLKNHGMLRWNSSSGIFTRGGLSQQASW